jgi:hypothetical protein
VSNFLKVELESKSGDAIKDYRLRANIWTQFNASRFTVSSW